MDSPSSLNYHHPRVLSPCSSGRRRSSTDSNSPEFEFWMLRNPSFPQPNLLSADELFVDGVLLPLQLLDRRPDTLDPEPEQNPEETHQEKHHLDPPDPEAVNPGPEQEPGPHISSESTTVLGVSKRWKDIFKKGEKNSKTIKKEEEKDKGKEDKKKKKKEKKKSHSGPGGAELNINIWPFSRSGSAGNATRPRWVSGASATRKVSSAPCSRSNSAGESTSRKWPSSPNRAGVHLGRSSPVWQVRRGPVKSSDPVVRIVEKSSETRRGRGTTTNGKTKVLNLNVPMCIGYRTHLSCRNEDNPSIAIGRSGGNKIGRDCGGSGDGGDTNNLGSSANLFNLRSLFTKKTALVLEGAKKAMAVLRNTVNDSTAAIANNWLGNCRDILDEVGEGHRFEEIVGPTVHATSQAGDRYSAGPSHQRPPSTTPTQWSRRRII